MIPVDKCYKSSMARLESLYTESMTLRIHLRLAPVFYVSTVPQREKLHVHRSTIFLNIIVHHYNFQNSLFTRLAVRSGRRIQRHLIFTYSDKSIPKRIQAMIFVSALHKKMENNKWMESLKTCN